MSAEPVMSVSELERFLEAEFPQLQDGGKTSHVEAIWPLGTRMRLDFIERNLRPGGTISGPAMMALADHAMYAVVLAHIGPVALAVTTSLAIDFLRKPEPREIYADARILKLGRRLAVGDVLLTQEGMDGPVARASVTYSIPPDR